MFKGKTCSPSVAGRIVAPKDVHVLIPRTREGIWSMAKGNSASSSADLELGRWSWIIRVGPTQGSLKVEEGGRRLRAKDTAA